MRHYQNFIENLDTKSEFQMDIDNIKEKNIYSFLNVTEYYYNSKLRMNDIYLQENENTSKKKKVQIDIEISNIQDLLNLIEDNPINEKTEYNINMKQLHNIYNPLKKLNNMIGMEDIKQDIVDQILYFIQELHCNKNDFMHTCIYGPPGTGKTQVAKIIGEIFSNLGILKKKSFQKVTRSDLIAGYLGQTAIKTKEVIKQSLGGVLFIDEAYSLGNREKKDIFAKECIDTLCECLSDYKDEFMVIIAGYEEDLERCFFSFNQGLNSRFTWRYNIKEYTGQELKNIFLTQIKNNGWRYKNTDINDKWFEERKQLFSSFGRDMEILFSKVKISHGKRVFCLSQREKKYIRIVDLENGLKLFKKHKHLKSNEMDFSFRHIYV